MLQSVSPRSFAWKVNLMITLVIVDCIANAFTEHIWGDDTTVLVATLFAGMFLKTTEI